MRLTEAGQRFLPQARNVLVAVEAARSSATGSDPGLRAQLIKLGTSTGLGVRLEIVLEALKRATPDVDVQLVSAPAQVRLERVRAGQLDATFVRGVFSAPGLEFIPVWQDELVVVLPASHELAACREVELSQLEAVPLRLVSRRLNQPLVDLVVGSCARAGFEPLLRPGSHTLQDTLAEIGTGSADLDRALCSACADPELDAGRLPPGRGTGAHHDDCPGRSVRSDHRVSGAAAAGLRRGRTHRSVFLIAAHRICVSL